MAEQRQPGVRTGVDAPPVPPDAEDGRWGVARLVAQREAERRARARAQDSGRTSERAPPADTGPTPPEPRRPRPPRPEPAVPPAPRAPLPPRPTTPRPALPAPRPPRGGVPAASDARVPRPRVEADLSLIGFSRRTRSRRGARMFTLFFVLVFAVIVIQTVASIV